MNQARKCGSSTAGNEPAEKVFLVYAPESSVFLLCGCGRSFSYFGKNASEKQQRWVDEHSCTFRTSAQGDGAGE